MEIIIGMKGESSTLVEKEDTAQYVGSGSLLVYATPCLAALMEDAACAAIEEALPQGQTSVGTALNLEHLSATPRRFGCTGFGGGHGSRRPENHLCHYSL